MKTPSYNMRPIRLRQALPLIEAFHSYASLGNNATYAFGVFEEHRLVAAFVWQPPPPGAARAVCPEEPAAVLSLSRMVAVPRGERHLNHISKPLRRQMRVEIDRSRWPVLLTYHDEGQDHTGHVYKCSGWQQTKRSRRPIYESAGKRISSYNNGAHDTRDLTRVGWTVIRRWEHWACPPGCVAQWMATHGWHRVPVPGKVWRSGNQAFTWVQSRT